METLSELFRAHFGHAPTRIEALSGAGSNRRYYRLHGENQTAIGVVGTSQDENRAFVYLTQHFHAQGFAMPELYAVSHDAMRYLQSDLGTRSLYDALSTARANDFAYGATEEALLERTLRALAHLQVEGAKGIEADRLLTPRRMDARAAMFDLNYFKYMFLRAQDMPLDELKLDDDMWRLACDLCGTPCDTFLYRDFQARNVMLDAAEKPWFIDYQGGRLGPLHYDVASFLYQASAHYPDALRARLVRAYVDELATLTEVSLAEFEQGLQRFVLLRTLQVLGAYGLRGIVERKTYFLNSIPAALDNLRALLEQDVCRPYPYLTEILQRLTEIDINYGIQG